LRRGRRKLGDASGIVVDDHRQIEMQDSRNRADPGLDVREPFAVVAALRCFFNSRADVSADGGQAARADKAAAHLMPMTVARLV
jgi:hypothetical protein